MRLGESLLHSQKFLQQASQLAGVEGIRTVGSGFLGIVVHLHENAVDAGRHGRARKDWNEFGLAAAGGVAIVVA